MKRPPRNPFTDSLVNARCLQINTYIYISIVCIYTRYTNYNMLTIYTYILTDNCIILLTVLYWWILAATSRLPMTCAVPLFLSCICVGTTRLPKTDPVKPGRAKCRTSVCPVLLPWFPQFTQMQTSTNEDSFLIHQLSKYVQ